MLQYEKKYWQSGKKYLAGIDEAGRGPLAGPVAAAAVESSSPHPSAPDYSRVQTLQVPQAEPSRHCAACRKDVKTAECQAYTCTNRFSRAERSLFGGCGASASSALQGEWQCNLPANQDHHALSQARLP